MSGVNLGGIWAIYRYELSRTVRTIWQSVATPVITTALYFIVFGGAIGSRIREVDGVSYGAFIVPGLMMLSLLTQSISNASIGIYFPKFTGTIFEILSAPMSSIEAVAAYVGAAATKSIVIGLVILGTATLFVPVRIEHPFWMIAFLDPDLGRLQPVRLHHRHLGENLRAARDHPGAHRHAADLSRRRVLFDRHAAAVLADGEPVQSGRLSGQRLPLELLRPGRRQRRREPRLHVAVHRRLPCRPRLDLPHRLAAEAVKGAARVLEMWKSRNRTDPPRERGAQFRIRLPASSRPPTAISIPKLNFFNALR